MNLREMRLALGKSVGDVAAECGVSKATVSGWESRSQGIAAKRVPTAAKAYGVSQEAIAKFIVDSESRRRELAATK